ncbi:T9SS type A sorting domain-containing protein [Tenacibaculum agarivorans]|uniref:T9SS type A sorting domain-containing protein n=1 Tax=Tenacibaculum agarivorans TaxID=1908389 RepID=UPI00094BB3B5|nr:T9SS type A sorting domain-containing protein [Tenacibaculum agarivorans]
MKTQHQFFVLLSFLTVGATAQVKERVSLVTQQFKTSTTDHSVVINTEFVSCKSLSVEDVENPNDLRFQVLPNPIKGGYCEIKFPNSYQKAKVVIIETSGKVLHEVEVSVNQPKVFVGDLAKGFYILQLKARGQKAIFKIIKE